MSQNLTNDLRAVIDDAEELLKNTADLSGEKIAALRQKVAARLEVARANLKNTEEIVREKSRQCADLTDQYVKENPWKAVGIAGAESKRTPRQSPRQKDRDDFSPNARRQWRDSRFSKNADFLPKKFRAPILFGQAIWRGAQFRQFRFEKQSFARFIP